MIQLQNFEQLEPTQPIEIDLAVLDLQSKFRTNLPWASNVYGKSYRTVNVKPDMRLVLPEVYLGNTNGKYSLSPVTPDNDKKGIIFFVIDAEKPLKWETNSTNYLTYNVGIVTWVNLELINKDLAKNEDFSQNLIKQMRDVLTNELIGMPYRVEILEVTREKNQVYKEFTLIEARYTQMPYSAFRFNTVITLRETCGLPPDRDASLLANITQEEIIRLFLPSIEFTGEMVNAYIPPNQREILLKILSA